jgi:hypothetical protein
MLDRADFKVDAKNATTMNVVLIYSKKFLDRNAMSVYHDIQNFVNNFNAKYRFPAKPFAVLDAGTNDREHQAAVAKYFSGKLPSNIFVLDFVKPRTSQDLAYPVVKQALSKSGHLSQFVNFKTANHGQCDEKKSKTILHGVARQILQKTGVRLWYVKIPPELPLPCFFVGVDIFHSPKLFSIKDGKRIRKPSCAAIIIEVIRDREGASTNRMEMYTKAFKRGEGEEYGLEDSLSSTVAEAMRILDVSPNSCIVWRDGIGEGAFAEKAMKEISGIRQGLTGRSNVMGGNAATSTTPIAFIVCQKRIDTKFLIADFPGQQDGGLAAPVGTLVTGLQGVEHKTFYINGTAPPFSTPKPARLICIQRDPGLNSVPLAQLSWQQCHAYANWAG